MIESSSFTLDPVTRRFMIGDSMVELRNMEFSLMRYLMENSNKVLSRIQILEDVWDRNIFCPTNTLDVHVSSLRQKLRLHLDAVVIRTVHCVGYVFDD